MKRNLLIAAFFFIAFQPQSSIYDIQIQAANGDTISMSHFKNKKILITVFNAANPDLRRLRFLDSLQRANSAINIIAVPTNEFGGAGAHAVIASLSKSRSLSFFITMIAGVRKAEGSSQYPLFKWLTDVHKNGHFNNDVESPDQLFIISRSGVLYSVLDMNESAGILNEVLKQHVE